MTLAELLIVVAIIGILAGLSFIAVSRYQRALGQLERDGIAKEIFVAAQNHLSGVYGEGNLEFSGDSFGIKGTSEEDNGKEIYYFVVNGTTSFNGSNLIDQMLPFGSIDETVRTGGSYIIRYQKDTGIVLDVFYCSRNGSPTAFNHTLNEGEYETVLGLTGDGNKMARRTWETGGNSILGWYGGEEAATLPTASLATPSISVVNEEKLYVVINDSNITDANVRNYASLKLIIEGKSSGAKKAYLLADKGTKTTSEERIVSGVLDSEFNLVLDDITASNLHFGQINADTDSKFIPGENIEVYAVAYSTEALANVAYSSKATTNSLFEKIEDNDSNNSFETALINNIRHLENLDTNVSGLGSSAGDKEKFSINKAEQTSDMSWITFKTKTLNADTIITSYQGTTFTNKECYYPITPSYSMSYDGKQFSISKINVNITGNAGLFGSTDKVTEIKNCELIDFNIIGTDSAGALAGSMTGTTVTNVIARNLSNAGTISNGYKITANSGDAGGLIGTMNSGTLQYSAAAVMVGDTVNRPSVAGGLVGKETGGSIVSCYSGGHTGTGSYETWVKNNRYDIIGTTVGGLAGTSSATISNSYSTCTVSGSIAGGLVGSAGGSVVSNCYATGLVKGTSKRFAFIGEGTSNLTGNYYYSVINSKEVNAPGEKPEPLEPYSGYVMNTNNLAKAKPLDLNVKTFSDFVGNTAISKPYDGMLVRYYNGKYLLKSIKELNIALPADYTWEELFVSTHYGDWPSPEVFFINPI